MAYVNKFLFVTLLCKLATSHRPIIDIFTNYPNTQEALKDYNRLLENRQLDDLKPPDSSSEFLTKATKRIPITTTTHKNVQSELLESKISKEVNFKTLPRTVTAKASIPIEFETASQPRLRNSAKIQKFRPNSRYGSHHDDIDGYDGYQFSNRPSYGQKQGFKNDKNGYWSNFHDYNDKWGSGANQNGGHDNDHDILESEYGTFESDSGGDLEVQSSINHVSKPNLLDLNNLMEIMATRPSFLTGATISSNYGSPGSINNNLSDLGTGGIKITKNRKNKTLILPPGYDTDSSVSASLSISPDFVDFDIDGHDDDKNDVLESDFGEIVSTTINRNKNRKGNVKRIPRPGRPKPLQDQGHKQGQRPVKSQVNKHHIGKLTSEVNTTNGKLKVTNLIRKYLIKMRNGTRTNVRKNRKQSRPSGNANGVGGGGLSSNINDRTFNWFDDKKTDVETSVKLHEGSEKYLLGHSYGGPLESLKNKTKHIASKFLSLFTVIQFANFRCQANSAVSQYEGICYLASECADRNGIAMGMCAEGHGVCCVFRGTCGGVGSNNCTYFESPGYPNYFPQDGGVVIPTTTQSSGTTGNSLTPDPRFPELLQYIQPESRQSESANALSCIFKVYKASDNVKQMRIDFIDLELAGPTNGNCVDEQLIISGSGLTTAVPVICGYNSGQHVLVDVSNLSGPLQLAVLANMINRKRYKLRICQYTDGCSGLMNCLQSYSGVTGQIQSLNYDQAVTFSRSTPGYFNNLNYAICIRREPGYCTITYSVIGPNGVVYPFELRNFDEDGELTVPAGQAGAGVINCPDDYIVINGIRLCGDRLNDGALIDDFTANAPVTDTSGGPIIIPVRTNGATTSRGFKLFYTQNRCTTNGGAAGTPDPRS